MLTLVDFETPLWLATSISKTAANFLRFHTGAVIMDEPCEAQFAVIDGSRGQQDLGAFCPGDDRYPDRSATVIVQCRSMTGGPTARLSGPGIRGSRCVSPAGLWPDFWNEAAANAERYPLGIDILLVADREIMGLPRSTQIALASEST